MDESEIAKLLRSNAPGKWEQIKKAASIALDHRRRVKEGDLFIFLFPLAAAIAKDAIFDFIPVVGTIFGVFITVYLFIFMWGRGRLLLRFVFFIIAVLDLIPFINLIPFNTASVLYAYLRARKDANESQAALSDMERQAPRLKRKLQSQAARMARATELQEERANRGAATTDGSAAGEGAPADTPSRPTSVRLARQTGSESAQGGSGLGRMATGAPAASFLGQGQVAANAASPALIRPQGASRPMPQKMMDGALVQPVHMRGRAANDAVYREGQPVVSGSDIASTRFQSRQSITTSPNQSATPNTVMPVQARSAAPPATTPRNQSATFQSVASQSGDAMMRIQTAGSRLSQSGGGPARVSGGPSQLVVPGAAASGTVPPPLVMPPAPSFSGVPKHPEQSKIFSVDPNLFEQESRAYMDTLDGIRGLKPEDVLRLRKIHTDFFQPYQEGQRSLSGLLRIKETAPQALEMLRKANINYRYRVDDTTWKKRAPELNSLPEFLSREVVASLDAIDEQLQRADLDEDEMRQLRNNAFYVVAEALDTASIENRQRIDAWLGEHEADIKALDIFTYNDGKNEDTLAFYTKQTIVANTENEDMARRLLGDLLARSVSPESKWKLDKVRLDVIAPILKHFDPTDMALAKRQALVAEVEAASFGLDKKIVEKWREAKVWLKKDEQGNDVYRESYSTNLWGVRHLEAVQPGAAATLYKEFGIANFSRYDRKMLLRQLEMKDEDVRYGVVVYPEADWNGAFTHNSNQLEQASEQLRSGGVETRIIEAASQRDLARRLLTLRKRSGGRKFAFAIGAGHGSENSLALGQAKKVPMDPPPFPIDGRTAEEILNDYDEWLKRQPYRDKGDFVTGDILGGEGIGRAFSEWFENGAPKVLISCSTGAEGGIAQHVSERSSGRVSAPKIPTNVDKIDVAFSEDGKITFDVKYHGTETAQYVAGKSS